MASYDPNQPANPFAAGPPAQQAKGGSPWKIVAIIVGLVVVLPMCCCGGCAGFFWVVADKSPAKNLALAEIEANDICIEKLGVPIEVELNNSSYNSTPSTATARFTVSGPKGSAVVDCQADKVGEEWVLTSGTVQFTDGTTLDLVAEPAGEADASTGPEIQLHEDPNEIPLGANRRNGEVEAADDSTSEENRPAAGIRN